METFIEFRLTEKRDYLITSPRTDEVTIGLERGKLDVAIRIPKAMIPDLVKELLEQAS